MCDLIVSVPDHCLSFYLAQSVECPFNKTRGGRFKPRWFFSFFLFLFFIMVILNYCRMDYKLFVFRNNIILIYLSRMKSCL